MNAIFGCLLSLAGGLLLIGQFALREYELLWLAVVMLCVGMFMLLRHRSDDDVIDHSVDGICSTCRGAGTVYSAEWNDWRRSGPIHNIRELCPSCQGMHPSVKATTTAPQPESRH